MTGVQLLVIAKEPVPGRVKTRLCPPATPEQAARIAAAALADTLDAVAATPAADRVLVLAGRPTGPGRSGVQPSASQPDPPQPDPPAGWSAGPRTAGVRIVPQHGAGFGDRLANAFADTARPGVPALLVGMDTPQITPELLTSAATALSTVDAVLGLAADGGWWTLGLREPRHAEVLRTVPMSTPDTGQLTGTALRARGLTIGWLPVLRDVDTCSDAHLVAEQCPRGRFARAVRALLPPAAADRPLPSPVEARA